MPALAPAREPLFTPRFAMLWVYAFVTFFSAFQLLPAIPFRILDLGGSKAEAGSRDMRHLCDEPPLYKKIAPAEGGFGRRNDFSRQFAAIVLRSYRRRASRTSAAAAASSGPRSC